jgi:hypothetical protein
MGTLPRFRLPDESSQRDISKVAISGSWDFDDLDKMETRVLEKDGQVMLRAPIGAGTTARITNVDDVVQDLRAAAAGRSSPVRELTSDDLLDDVPDADDVQVVDVSELVFDRVVARRNVWNVQQAARPTQASIVGPNLVRARFLATVAMAMLLGALLAVLGALALWRLSGLSI